MEGRSWKAVEVNISAKSVSSRRRSTRRTNVMGRRTKIPLQNVRKGNRLKRRKTTKGVNLDQNNFVGCRR